MLAGLGLDQAVFNTHLSELRCFLHTVVKNHLLNKKVGIRPDGSNVRTLCPLCLPSLQSLASRSPSSHFSHAATIPGNFSRSTAHTVSSGLTLNFESVN